MFTFTRCLMSQGLLLPLDYVLCLPFSSGTEKNQWSEDKISVKISCFNIHSAHNNGRRRHTALCLTNMVCNPFSGEGSLRFVALWRVHIQVKPLGVIWGKYGEFYNRKNTIMFDDIGRNFLMNPQNGLKVDNQHDHFNFIIVIIAIIMLMFFAETHFVWARSDRSWRPILTGRRTGSYTNYLSTSKKSPSLMTSADSTTNTGRGRTYAHRTHL